MPSEKFSAVINDVRNYAADSGKKGLHATCFISAKWTTAEGIAGSFSLTGPQEVMMSMFKAWPLNLKDPLTSVETKVPVEIELSIVGVQTTGSMINSMAADAAQDKPAAEAPTAEGLEAMKAEIEQLAK